MVIRRSPSDSTALRWVLAALIIAIGSPALAQGQPAAEGAEKAEEAAKAAPAAAEEAAAEGEKAAAEAEKAAAEAAPVKKPDAPVKKPAEPVKKPAEPAPPAVTTPPPAEPKAPAGLGVPFPSLYLGVSFGGHFVLTDWDLGELDETSAPVSPDNSTLLRVRLGYQLAEKLAIEGAISHLPVPASAETNDVMLYDLDVLYYLKNAPWSGFVVGGVGGYHNLNADQNDADFDFQFHLGLGTKYRLTDWLWARGEVRWYASDSLDEDLPLSNNLEASLGLDINLWPSAGPKDRDNDTIIDDEDKCPDVPGEKATAGCPDRDRDGVADAEDQCPDAAGPAELKGCPDRDGDGVIDPEDKCPDEKGVPENNGCPAAPVDSDGDGLLDPDDKCPQKPEDKDGIEDKDGCPEDDADGDGILDGPDKCPITPETKNNFEDEDGCPDEAPKVVVTCDKFELNEAIFFETGKDTIQERSFRILDTLVEALNKNPEVEKIRIEGHTDNVGRDASNQRLSQARARAVRKYLTGKGVKGGRLDAKGYGESRPIDTNDTEEGRAKNRRVDFVIVKQRKREGCE